MKLYFVKSATASNYVLAETSSGVLCSNCAPDGCWAGISLYGYEDEEYIDGPTIAARLADATDPDLDEFDLDWMGDPCYESMADWEAEQEAQEPFNRDQLFLVGIYGG